ncbi:hypothetical protein [Kribbella sp. DT2]|uniref:hypothetical protein n=1 Tax=Kribbella sp. DT2 TaxID=3393427 RepID=UPI003CF2B305
MAFASTYTVLTAKPEFGLDLWGGTQLLELADNPLASVGGESTVGFVIAARVWQTPVRGRPMR